MKKTILLAALLFSATAFAQNPKGGISADML